MENTEDNTFDTNSNYDIGCVIDDTNLENIQSPEYDKYRNLLNIFNEIESECIKFKDKYQLDTYSFMKWLSLIVEEIGSVSQELNNFALHNNDVYEIRAKLMKLAATIVAWIEMLNGTSSQTSDSKKQVNINSGYNDINWNYTDIMCPDCISYMFITPKAFCNNLEHIKYPRN